MRVLAVVNGRAGGGTALKHLPGLRQRHEAGPHDVSWQVTSSVREMQAVIAGAAPMYDALLLVGGDGTIHEALPPILTHRIPFSIAPAGRGNDFARNVNIPRRPAMGTFLNAEPDARVIDAPTVNGRPFASVASVGLDAVVSRLARDGAGRFRGTTGYIFCVLRALARHRPVEVEVTVDGERWAGRATLVAVANGRAYGGGMCIAPSAAMDDGLLDVCIVAEMPRHTLLTQFPRVFRGTHVSHPKVLTTSGTEITVTSPIPLEVVGDGEPMGHTPVTAAVGPGNLTVLRPPTRGKARPS